MNIQSREIRIIHIVKAYGPISFSDIACHLPDIAERTLSRELATLTDTGYLHREGSGRSVVYSTTIRGGMYMPFDVDAYVTEDVAKREGVHEHYEHDVWRLWPRTLFEPNAMHVLNTRTEAYRTRVREQTPDIHQRELERFVIEMSWKSSRIEGNTYTLLDTELLLQKGIASTTNTKEETQMILNHKEAFDAIYTKRNTKLTRALIEDVHKILVADLHVDTGLRTRPVGITGSRYTPLAIPGQIRDALNELVDTINSMDDAYSAALTALIGISYIQPFADGNKRTARLIANSILMAHMCAPLSYRDVDERTYRAALLVFYEQLSIIPMRSLFEEQYMFSAQHYGA